MSVQVRMLEPDHEPIWDHYVDNHPAATLFHTLLWRNAVRDGFGHRAYYAGAWRDERLVGVFPLMSVSSRLAGTILVSVPYGVYGGTLADDEQAHTALLSHARDLADKQTAQWIDIRSVEPQWPELPVVRRYVTFRKQLPEDPAHVLAELPRKARAAARHARYRHGLTVEFGDAHLNTVWMLYSQSMRRLASLNYPLNFFQLLVERTQSARVEMPDDRAGCVRHIVQIIRHEGRPIAGLLSFIYRDTLMPYFAGSDERYEKLNPNNFLYLTAMEQGARLGCRSFDFGRSRVDNTGSYNFKRFQGFEPTPLHYQYYVPRRGRAPDLHPANPRLRLVRQLWPRLPLRVTRPLGAWLAKSIPG